MDSNNFSNKCGIGERESRIFSGLVAKRHYGFGHGLGRSGDLVEAQPKAVGSSILGALTNDLLFDVFKTMGLHSAKKCLLVPMATGMTMLLCLLSLKSKRSNAKYVLWSRIDQKSCFKSITTAGLVPIIIDTVEQNQEFVTNLTEFENEINLKRAENIVCILSTSSCFAPRGCDDLISLAKLAKHHNIPHVINNAYGLQSTFCTHQIEQASRIGRVDLFVQSTDKNLMVPVGGAIISGPDQTLIESIGKSYAGRASASQSIDVFITLLSMGKSGYLKLVKERKDNFIYLREKLSKIAIKYNENVINIKRNPISLAMTLKNIDHNHATRIGSMLFTRGVSGTRVVTPGDQKIIDGYEFKNWGNHKTIMNDCSYLTAAAGLGITKNEIDMFVKKLDQILDKMMNTRL